MSCLGAVVIVACIAAFVLVLVRFPKQTIGCSVALVVLAVLSIALLLEHDKERGERARERDAAVAVSIAFARTTCGAANPLAVTVRNGTSDTLNAVEMRLEVYRPGFSTDLLQSSYDEHTLKWDKILAPGQQATLCYSLPRTIAYNNLDSASTLQYRVGYKYPRFQ